VELAEQARARDRTALIADVGSDGPPEWVIDGYATLFAEAADQADYYPIIVPVGVGSLAAAAARHGAQVDAAVVAVEPAARSVPDRFTCAGRADIGVNARHSNGGQGDVSALLRRVADCIAELGEVEVLDLVMHVEVAEDGNWPLGHGVLHHRPIAAELDPASPVIESSRLAVAAATSWPRRRYTTYSVSRDAW
jgi:hypothetical protein